MVGVVGKIKIVPFCDYQHEVATAVRSLSTCTRLREAAYESFHLTHAIQIAFNSQSTDSYCLLTCHDVVEDRTTLLRYLDIQHLLLETEIVFGGLAFPLHEWELRLLHHLEHLPKLHSIQVNIELLDDGEDMLTPQMTSQDFGEVVRKMLDVLKRFAQPRKKTMTFTQSRKRSSLMGSPPYAAILDMVDDLRRWIPELTVQTFATSQHPLTVIKVKDEQLREVVDICAVLFRLRNFPYSKCFELIIEL